MKKATVLLCVLLTTACTQKTAEEQVADAIILAQEGEQVAAIVELKNAIIKEPNNAEARFLLGSLEFDQGQWEESEKELRRAIDLGYSLTETYPLLIKSIYYQNDFQRVLSELENIPEFNDTQIISTLALYEYLSNLKSGEQEPVIPAQKLMREELLIAQAYQTLENGQPDVALNITKEFTVPKIEPFEKLLLKGMIASLMGDTVDAIISYNEALNIYPTYHVARFMLAEQLIQDKQLARAEEEVDRLLALNPNSGHANYLKSLVYFYQDEYEQALRFANVALQNEAKPAMASFIAGTSAYHTGRLESALRLLSIATNTLPPSHPSHRLLAQVKLELGYVEEVASNLDELNLDAGLSSEIYSLAALQKLQQGQAAKSKEYLSKAKGLDPDNPVGLLREGYILLDENKESASKSLTKALSIDPDLNEAWVLLAQVRFDQEGLESALAVADEWSKLNPLNGELLKGIIYLRDNNEKQANVHFANLLKADPDNKGALRYLMIGEARQDNFDTAMSYARRLLDLAPDDLQTLIDVINIMIAQGKENQLISFLTKRREQYSDATAPISALAFIYLRNEQPDNAISLLKSIDDPQHFGIYQALGDAYIEKQNFKQALETYQEWVNKFPTDNKGWYRLISTYQFMNDFDGALLATQEAKRYNPQDKRLILLEAHLAASIGKFAQSKRAIELLSQDDEKIASLTHTKGLLALNEKRYKEAVTYLKASYEATPGFSVARLLAFALAGINEPKSGLDYLLKEVENKPDKILHKMVSAEYATTHGFYEQAKSLYQKVLDVRENDFAALNNLASVYILTGELDSALELAERAIKLAPNSEYAIDTMGYALLKSGKVAEGTIYIEKALGKAPNNKEIQLHTVEAYILNNELQRADTMLKRIRPSSQSQQNMYKNLKQQLQELNN